MTSQSCAKLTSFVLISAIIGSFSLRESASQAALVMIAFIVDWAGAPGRVGSVVTETGG